KLAFYKVGNEFVDLIEHVVNSSVQYIHFFIRTIAINADIKLSLTDLFTGIPILEHEPQYLTIFKMSSCN
ncbi:MAG TPA: hypothetical protein VL921_19280, partial [Candidatus Udaeobacter sp.]|nr:hypothetical protein [Candidatus Udaeobacter sp.]